MKMIIIRYSEIALKGKNRPFFENTLIKNIKSRFPKINIKNLRNRILINISEKLDLSKIFGIANYSYVEELDLDLEKLNKKALELSKNSNTNEKQSFSGCQKSNGFFSTFRITCQRIDKSIPLNSIDIERSIGEFVFENSNIKVKLKNPEINIQIELFNNHSYIFTEKIKAAGGLPVGVEGTAIALIENQDSIKAALAAMKRGCNIIPVGFEKHDLSELANYGLTNKLKIIKDFKEIETLAEQHNAKALIVNQKLNNFKEISTKLLVLRPLIAE